MDIVFNTEESYVSFIFENEPLKISLAKPGRHIEETQFLVFSKLKTFFERILKSLHINRFGYR